MRLNKIKAKMRAGEKAYGLSFTFPSTPLVELIGLAGYDYIHLDGEHGVFTLRDIEDMCRAADLAGLATTARVPDIQRATILHFLDRGVMGIIGPHIFNKEDAEALVEACMFAPQGERSFGGSRGNDYGAIQDQDRPDFMARMNEEILPMALLEDIEALEKHLPRILEVEHLEIFSFGAQDVAQSMGLPGQPGHPRVVEAIKKASARVRAAGKKVRSDVLATSNFIPFFLEAARDFLEKAEKA